MEINNLLACLSKEERKKVEAYSIAKGTTLFHEGEECLLIGIVVKGEIEIVSYSIEGKTIIYNTLKKGEVFGGNLLFSSSNTYKGNVIAKEKSTVALIKKDNLVQILKNNEAFLLEYLKLQSNFGKSLNQRIKVLSYESSEDRLLVYLSFNKNEIKIKSVTALADELCMSRESLSRCITRLIKKHLIVKNGKVIKKL